MTTIRPCRSLRCSFAALLFVASSTAASTAAADESTSSVTPATPAETTAPRPASPEPAGRGFVMTVGTGASYLGGDFAKQLRIAGAQMNFNLRIGAYFTERFGVLAGVQGGYGSLTEGCSAKCSDGYSYQLPVLVQYSLRDRRRGVYFEGGVGLLSTYGGSSKNAASPESLMVRSDADVKLGIGYRAAPFDAKTGKDSASGLDIRFGVDVGRFDRVEYTSLDGSVDGDIAHDMRATHFVLGLGIGYHFTP